METIITMIILTGTAVLFLSNVFRQVRDERERSQQRRVNLPRRQTTSTEQFLEEMNRRRQQAAERAKPRPPARPIGLTSSPAQPSRRETVVRKGPSKAERLRPTPTPAKQPFVVPAGKMLEVLPADKPPSPSPLPRGERARGEGAEPPTSQQPVESPAKPVVKVTTRPLPVMLAQLMPLLQSRQTLRAAFLLHEILGPPLSKRGRPIDVRRCCF